MANKLRETIFLICQEVDPNLGISADKATQALLQIIESDVIGSRSWHTCYDSSKCNRDCKGMIENDLRADQRANLREDK